MKPRLVPAAFALVAVLLTLTARQATAVSPVTVYVSVVDADGRAVTGLSANDFEIRDEGKPQTLSSVQAGVDSLSIVLLLDASGSMTGNRESMLVGAEILMAALAPADRVQVGVFADKLTIDPEFTTDRADPMRWLRLHPFRGNGTSAWDSAYASLDALATQPGRHALVFLSDAEDTSSRRSQSEVLRRAQEINCRIDVANFWPPFFPGGGGPSRPIQTIAVKTLVEQSGGLLLVRQKAPDLPALVAQLAADLHNQYVLEFTPAMPDDKRHKLEVLVKTKGAKVRARRAYGPSH